MLVRALDIDHDWTFGKSQNDYLRNKSAVIQNIDTRLNEFLGDCFFNNGAGIDWFNLLGAKDQAALKLAITTVILNTAEVVGLLQLSSNLNDIRNLNVQYTVQTTYGNEQRLLIINPTGS